MVARCDAQHYARCARCVLAQARCTYCGECAVKPIVQADEYVAASECDQERSRVQGASRCGILRRLDDDAVAVQKVKQSRRSVAVIQERDVNHIYANDKPKRSVRSQYRERGSVT